MIIGIDETGSFALTNKEMNLFAGVHFVDETERNTATANLDKWKSKYKRFKNYQGEIKGASLNNEMTMDFVDMVIMTCPTLYISCCAVIPAQHTKRDIQLFRDHHIKSIDEGIRKFRSLDNEQMALEYTHLRNWYRKINYQLLLKTWILGEMIGFSFVEHVTQVILDNKDRTLGTIQINIDRDFIHDPQTTIFWKDLLRSHFYSYTYEHHIPVLKEWPLNHPFYVARDRSESGLIIDTEHVFKNGCNFVNSHQNPEIQIADILASIISGYNNRKLFAKPYGKIREKFIPIRRQPITLLRLIPSESADRIPNPYEEILDR